MSARRYAATRRIETRARRWAKAATSYAAVCDYSRDKLEKRVRLYLTIYRRVRHHPEAGKRAREDVVVALRALRRNRAAARRYVVLAELAGVGPMRCARPYPRRDHLDAFGWENEDAAEAFAAELRARFPSNAYSVAREDRERGS